MTENRVAWVALDWGTSNLRSWLIGADGAVLAARSSELGMSALDPSGFEPALLGLIAPDLPQAGRVPVIACGMVGARQGWIEAPYRAVPCPPPGLADAARPVVADPRLDVRILPGVKQTSPPDVMRGEETQIAGFLAREPEFDGVLCLPGTHTKWVHISAGEIVSFRTCMTGELFALLSRSSVLRHSVAGEGWDSAAFDDAVSDALSSPARLGSRLFALRADALLNGTDPATGRARLSGLLLGLELASMRDYWLGRDVALVGEPGLAALYHAALGAQGVAARAVDGAALALEGLRTAYGELNT